LTARSALIAAFFSWYDAFASLKRPNRCLPYTVAEFMSAGAPVFVPFPTGPLLGSIGAGDAVRAT
jgi:hypothetical protein